MAAAGTPGASPRGTGGGAHTETNSIGINGTNSFSTDNSDQGSQFTWIVFTQTLKAAGMRISMDGRGRWLDNALVERLWRSLKYECVYLHAWKGGRKARVEIGKRMDS